MTRRASTQARVTAISEACPRGGTSTFIVGEGEVTERASYSAVTSDGSQQGGRSETVWKRQEDGSWKIARLIAL